MKFSSVIIGIVILTAMVTGLYTFTNALADENYYNVNVDSVYEQRYGNMTGIYEEVNETQYAVNEWVNDKTSFLALIPHTLSLIQDLIILPFQILGGMIAFGTTDVGFPAWVQVFLVSLILALILFAFLALVLRYRYT